MKVLVTNISVATKTAQVTVGNNSYITRLVEPKNKGKENELWVDIRPLKVVLGEGDHKGWLTIEKTTVQAELETLKQERPDNFITIQNLIKYCTKEEYEQVLAIWNRAQKALDIQKAERLLANAKK